MEKLTKPNTPKKKGFLDRILTVPVLAAISLVLVVVPIVFYSAWFGPAGLSKNQGNWASFATFITAFATIANLFVVYGIAVEAKELTSQGNEESRLFQEAYEKPLIYMSQRTGSSKLWYINNLGRGAALNIQIAIEFSPTGLIEHKPTHLVKAYALAAHKGSLVVSSQFRGILRFFVIYEDVRQRKFISVSNNHETKIEELSNFKSIDFGNYTFDEATLAKISSLPHTNTDQFLTSWQCTIVAEEHIKY
jgi:hypothetical protein